jgi:hypothetical protein
MNTNLQRLMFALAVVGALTTASNAVADPITGRDRLKFEQLPMDGTLVNDPNGTVQKYYGHDELSTAYGFPNTTGVIPLYSGRYMADDFADNLSSPVVHVKWWGSYLNNFINPNMPVNRFLISFETDVPAGPAPSFSRPGTPIVTQTVKRGPISPSSGTFTETAISPGGAPLNETLYEYNAELNLGADFKELKDTVYWIKIAALVDVPGGITFPPSQPPTFATRWGWHNRDYTIQDTLASPVVTPGENLQGPINGTPIWHFQDDAVTGLMRWNPFDPNPQSNLSQPVSTMTPTRYIDGVDGPAGLVPGAFGIGAFSKDLAFALYTTQIPEPATCSLTILGLIAVVSMRRRPNLC